MKHTLTKNDVVNLLMDDENARWSREAAEWLADYYEEAEEASGEEMEFDRVAIRCEWDEMTAREVAEAYGIETDQPEEDIEAEVERMLERKTTFAKLPTGGFIFAAF